MNRYPFTKENAIKFSPLMPAYAGLAMTFFGHSQRWLAAGAVATLAAAVVPEIYAQRRELVGKRK